MSNGMVAVNPYQSVYRVFPRTRVLGHLLLVSSMAQIITKCAMSYPLLSWRSDLRFWAWCGWHQLVHETTMTPSRLGWLTVRCTCGQARTGRGWHRERRRT